MEAKEGEAEARLRASKFTCKLCDKVKGWPGHSALSHLSTM